MPTIVFVDVPDHDNAVTFYKLCPSIPINFSGGAIQALGVGNVIAVKNMSLFKLLDEIFNNVLDVQSIMVTSHASPEMWSIPIGAGCSQGINLRNAKLLNQFAEGDRGAANKLGITNSDYLDVLEENLSYLRRMNIPHLAIDACRIGTNIALLEEIMKLFNAKSLSAHQLRTSYGHIDPKLVASKAAFDAEVLKAQPGVQVFGLDPHRLAFKTYGHKHSKFLTWSIRQSDQGLVDFTRNQMPESYLPYQGKHFIHGLWDGTKLIMPKTYEYTRHITYMPAIGLQWAKRVQSKKKKK